LVLSVLLVGAEKPLAQATKRSTKAGARSTPGSRARPQLMAPAVFVHRFRSNPYSVLVFSYTPEEAV
jgi:hypothetical protein